MPIVVVKDNNLTQEVIDKRIREQKERRDRVLAFSNRMNKQHARDDWREEQTCNDFSAGPWDETPGT